MCVYCKVCCRVESAREINEKIAHNNKLELPEKLTNFRNVHKTERRNRRVNEKTIIRHCHHCHHSDQTTRTGSQNETIVTAQKSLTANLIAILLPKCIHLIFGLSSTLASCRPLCLHSCSISCSLALFLLHIAIPTEICIDRNFTDAF